MKELFRLLISDNNLSPEEKMDIVKTLNNAMHDEMYPIEENGLYLRVINNEDADKMDVALWYNHLDEDGNRSVRIITTDKKEILDNLHAKYLEKKENNQRTL